MLIMEENGSVRKENAKEVLGRKLKETKEWFHNNKEAVLVIAPIAIGCVATVTKVVGRRVNLHKEQVLKDMYCYDRSGGHYWALSRKLSNAEWTSIEARRKSGEKLSDILNELKVLK